MFKGLFGKKETAMAASPPKVILAGMNERALNLFTMFLNGPARGQCEIVDDGSHQIVIIDLDAADNTRLWSDLRRQFSGPAIVLSVREQTLTNAFWVAKPVKAEHFSAALARAKNAIQQTYSPPVEHLSKPVSSSRLKPAVSMHTISDAQQAPKATGENEARSSADAALGMNANLDERAQNCCGDIPDTVYLDIQQRDMLFGDCKDNLVHYMQEALRMTAKGGVVNLSGLSAHPFYVSAAEDFVSTPVPEAFLRSLCVRSSDSARIKLVFVDKTPAEIGPSDDRRLRCVDNMLWKLALWSSRGRVAMGTSLDAPVRLRAWPNIPRLMTVPHSLRIAALWVMQPTGLLETARKLNVPHRFVFAFYCACKAFDLVEQLGAEVSSGVKHEPKKMTEEKRGLFGSLLKKLGF
ncbi:MAG: hypothetical protein AB7S56_07945 [Halothiobacillaceae bacterium]